jgi:hypothetical protein
MSPLVLLCTVLGLVPSCSEGRAATASHCSEAWLCMLSTLSFEPVDRMGGGVFLEGSRLFSFELGGEVTDPSERLPELRRSIPPRAFPGNDKAPVIGDTCSSSSP